MTDKLDKASTMSYVPVSLQAVTFAKFLQDHGYMRATVFTTVLTSALLAGCAYAPSGTLVDALEPEGVSRSSMMAAPASAAPAPAPEVAVPDTDLPAATPPVAYGPTTGPVDGAGQGAAIAAPIRNPDGLLTEDAAAATRARLQEIARSRGGASHPANASSVNQLKKLGESHGARAISEIEADGGSD